MNLNHLHRRLLQDVLEIGNAFPLVITGGYAVQAHRIVDRFSRDIDMATDSPETMEAIVTKMTRSRNAKLLRSPPRRSTRPPWEAFMGQE